MFGQRIALQRTLNNINIKSDWDVDPRSIVDGVAQGRGAPRGRPGGVTVKGTPTRGGSHPSLVRNLLLRFTPTGVSMGPSPSRLFVRPGPRSM